MWSHEQHHNRPKTYELTVDCVLENKTWVAASGGYFWADRTLQPVKNPFFSCFWHYFAYKTFKTTNWWSIYLLLLC